MIRTDSAGGTHGFLDWLTAKHRNFSYSVGFPIHGAVAEVLPLVPKNGWTKAYDSNGTERDGAWVADITGMLDLSSWPAGMRVIVRKEIPHVGAQLRITDIDSEPIHGDRDEPGKRATGRSGSPPPSTGPL